MFTPREWLYIDICNKVGNDKLLYKDRILWTLANYDELESFKPEKNTAYQKAVLALRDTDNGIPSGHLVELDAIASGIAILSTASRCVTGMVNTGVISDGTRPDPYTKLTTLLNLPEIPRADAKDSLMQHFYGGTKTAELVFEDKLPQFHRAAQQLAPRAYDLIDTFVNAWQPMALEHVIITPNQSKAEMKVWATKSTKIQVPNLDNRTFTFNHKVNQGAKKGLSLVANCTHLTDAFMVQELGARCNYTPEVLLRGKEVIEEYIGQDVVITDRTKIPSLDVLPLIDGVTVTEYSFNYLAQLLELIERSLEYRSFPVLMNHDSFKCHANNVEQMRKHFNYILWDLYNSTWLSDMHYQLTGKTLPIYPHSEDIANLILENEYHLN